MDFDISKAVEKHGPIFSTITPESKVEVYFRLVTKKEYDTFNSLSADKGVTEEAEDYLYKTAIVYPPIEKLDEDIYAGEASLIVGEIIKKSGFFDLPAFIEAVNYSRAECQKLSEQIITFIAKAMPGYKIAELENLTYQEIARLLAMSEVILGQVLDIGSNKPPSRKNLLSKELSPEELKSREELKEQAKGALSAIRERH
jgi:hypothetical protein